MSKFFKGASSSSESSESGDETRVIQKRPAVRDFLSEGEKLPDFAAAQLVKKKEAKPKKFNAESDAESDSDYGDDDLGSSYGSEIELEGKQMEDLRKFFLKKEKAVNVKEKEIRKNKEVKAVKDVESDEDDPNGQWMKIRHKDDPSKPLFEPKAKINPELVIKKLAEVNGDRGKKSTNRKIHLKYLQELYDITADRNFGMGILAKILFSIASSQFEVNARVSDAMEFKSTLEIIDGLFSLLTEHQNVHISSGTNEDEENLTNPDEPFRIHGSAVLLVKRLDDELTKIFQHTDRHSTDYIEKLRGERELCTLIDKVQSYIDIRRKSSILDPNEIVTIYMLHIDHLYYKFSPDELRTKVLMDNLCKVVYSMDKAMQQRQRAMLCQIYHHALHDRWQEAKNLLLMSHLQAIADHLDVKTQVLYNRTICQLGLCAFRHGFIREAHMGLHEIQNTQKVKELLAQGVSLRNAEKTPGQEIMEKAVQVPYHMHINLELMEFVYLICSMLLEIPNIGRDGSDQRRRLLSRSFHYQLKFSEKFALIGPPENTREHVVAASRAMLRGDWVKCRDFIINEKMDTKVWNLFRNSGVVKSMVMCRIQEETLRTYLLMYSTVYKSLSLETLCQLFELGKKRVYSLICETFCSGAAYPESFENWDKIVSSQLAVGNSHDAPEELEK